MLSLVALQFKGGQITTHVQWRLDAGHIHAHHAHGNLARQACLIGYCRMPRGPPVGRMEFLGPAGIRPGTLRACTPAGRQHISFRVHDRLTHAVHASTDLAIVGPRKPLQSLSILCDYMCGNRHRRATSSLLQAFSPPSLKTCPSEGTSSYCFSLLLLVLSRSYSLYSGEHFLLCALYSSLSL